MLIVILGATGNVGAAVVAAETAAGHTVRAVSRSGGSSRAGVEHVVGDLGDAASYAGALDGADALFTLAGYAGLGGTLDALAPSGAAVALLSSSAAPSGDRDNAVARYHLESEDLVAASGLPGHDRAPQRVPSQQCTAPAEPSSRPGDVVREPFGDVPLSVIDPADIGAVVPMHGLEGFRPPGTYRVTGPESLTAGAAARRAR